MSMEQILKARQERIDTLHEIQRDRTALLVIDMQRGFLEPGAALEVPPGRELIPCIKRLIDCCREISVPVIFTEFVYSSALPCLRGDPFGPEHLPSEVGKPTKKARKLQALEERLGIAVSAYRGHQIL